ncbi:MAG TPA: pitrilysin family protein [Bacteroidales bacterium]|nr:pitrilysin family protein [Bacteroidales bacterium]
MHELSGGVPVYLLGTGTLDLLRIEFVLTAGQRMEEVHLAASTANAMLTEGTIVHNAMSINDLIDRTGAAFTHMADKDTACLIAVTLTRKLGEVMALAAEVLFQPSFPETEFRMLMEKRMQSYHTNRQKTSVIAREELYRALFGPDNAYGRVTVPEDYTSLTLEDARRFHSNHYRPSNMYITVAGKDPEIALPELEKYFSCGSEEKWSKPTFPDLIFKTASPGRIFTEVSNSVQSGVRLGWRGITREHPDYQGLQVANVIMGGYFGSRLMRNIREEKGFTYGISSVASALRDIGFIAIVTEVTNEYREQTIEEIRKEITELTRNEVSSDELRIVRNHIMGEIARTFDGPFASAEAIRGLIDYGPDPDYYVRFEERVKTITPGEIKDLVTTYYNIDTAIEIVAGAK